MGSINAALFIALDGVVEAPQTWHFEYFNDEMGAAVGGMMAGNEAMLLGRQTYDEFASFWPDADPADPTTAQMNGTPKYVVSTTLDKADWENSTVVSGDVKAELLKLKQNKRLGVTGSPTLVRWLLREGLVDERGAPPTHRLGVLPVSAALGSPFRWSVVGHCMAGKHESVVRGRVSRRAPRKLTLVGAIGLVVAMIAGAVFALAAPSWAAGPPGGTPVAGTPCTASASACVDLTGLQAWLIKDGQVVYGPVSISTGVDADPSKRTPPGDFNVSWKHIDHVSTISKTPRYPKGVPMPYSVFFNGGIAFHEGDLGAESLGCIHLEHAAAVTFFNTLQVGQQVQVRNPR